MATATATLEAYAPYVEGGTESGAEGSANCTAMVLSTHPLSAAARDALSKSLASLGFISGHAAGAAGALTFAILSSEEGRLGPADAFAIVEGVDPLCLVIADADAAQTMSQAYRCPVDVDDAGRVFGRPCAAFRSFEDMLADSAEKQRAWAILKRIPRIS